jgi:hypothetical protein
MERLPANIQNYIKLQDPQLREMVQPVGESSGLTMVGKWGRGDGWEVSGKDSLVFYSLGSECAIVNFAKPDSPQVLAVEFRGHNERLLTTG